MASGAFIVISAPSGAGKTSIVKTMCAANPAMVRAVSYTTRPPRAKEVDGQDYYFVSEDQFNDLANSGGFFEHANVFGHQYGTPKAEIVSQLERGKDVVVDIDWQGALQLRQGWSDVLSIFVLPPSLEALVERLSSRGQDDAAVIARRMAEAQNEMTHYDAYDYMVLNNDLDQAVKECQHIVQAHHLRTSHQAMRLAPLLVSLLPED